MAAAVSNRTMHVVDLRGDSADAPPLPGALVVSPPSSWQDYSMELPPRGTYFRVLFDPRVPESAVPASAFVAQFTPWALATRSDDATFWSDVCSATPLARMWHPGPLTATLALKLPEWLRSDAPPAPVRVLDVGSGTGRNAVFLALEAGCECVCLDNRQVLADKCDRFAARAGAGATVKSLCAEAEAWLAARVAACVAPSLLDDPGRATVPTAARLEPSPSGDASVACPRIGDGIASSEGPVDPIGTFPVGGRALALHTQQRRGRVRLGTGGNEGVSSASADLRPFDVFLFARFTNKPALLLAARLMEAQVLAATYGVPSAEGVSAASASPGSPPRASLLAVESFHASAPHPARREQTLAEGELLALIAPGSPAPCMWEAVLEDRVACEDGRPLIRSVLRCVAASPAVTPAAAAAAASSTAATAAEAVAGAEAGTASARRSGCTDDEGTAAPSNVFVGTANARRVRSEIHRY